MYLSKLHLRNWRVYDDATFEFRRPTKRRPITLIGAENGHGKTSFLMALYLGLFGKYGLPHCEGFRRKLAGDDAAKVFETMRNAMSYFRRLRADPEEPTEIELVFSPANAVEDFRELRIHRRWFFTSGNKPKSGDAFESLEIHVADNRYPDGRPLAWEDFEDAHRKLERRLFPAHLTPAFFFDGEQAAELIESMGDGGMRRAVEVMFGTKLVSETTDRLQTFISRTSAKGAGKRKASELEQERDTLDREVIDINRARGKLQQQREELSNQRDEHERQREEIKRQLSQYGGVNALSANPEELQRLVEVAEKAYAESRRILAGCLGGAGLALAVSRLHDRLLDRLEREGLLEEYERVKEATLSRREAVVARALPDPPESDPLLGNLAEHVRQKIKVRIAEALAAIYDPPPARKADEFLLGHVMGDDARGRLRAQIADAAETLAPELKRLARDHREASAALHDANDRLRLAKDKPSEAQNLIVELEKLNRDIQAADQRLGELNVEINAVKVEMERKNQRLGEIREKLKELGPDQMRVAIADRARRAFEAFSTRLRDTTAGRLQDVLTERFLEIADRRRFSGSTVELGNNKPPTLHMADGTDLQLSSGSGFERRSFSIAFCLALAEITGQRIPLVIDTPVGNAGTDYRLRALDALAKFDTDQIIILTHDEEVRLPFLEAIEDRVAQKILVAFDHDAGASRVHDGKFFSFSR
jgi:DNA sulfur modification protein DndD